MKKKKLSKTKLVKGMARKLIGQLKSVRKHKVKGSKFKGKREDGQDSLEEEL